MTRTELRLEILKIADKPGRDHQQMMSTAEALLKFAIADEELSTDSREQEQPKVAPKKSNPK